MQRALIIINAYAKAESFSRQSTRIKEELALRNVAADIVRNDRFLFSVTDGEIAKGEILKSADYSFVVYLDKDKYCSEALEKLGYRLFNSHEAICVCDDKMLTHLALAKHGIPMPSTLAGFLCYTPSEPILPETVDEIARKLGYPVIVKTCYGSLGKGVFKADDRQSLAALCEKLKCEPHLFQRCITSSLGRDIRVIVIGGKAVAAMKRESETGDFRSNIGCGGKGSAIEIDDCLAAISEKCANVLGLDFCGIDLLFDENGYTVCEVNSNAFFEHAETVTKVNIAALYARHIADTMKK